ncbi:hypothetical protein O6H91_10G045000 [Diphasiastrum complanatum]|nr:hypothetical protein O6H91_10G045000 [Diphasiastrum complanatum]
MVITDTNPKWEMETMPISRVMGDMIILPNAQILIVNGAQRGSAGWGLARDPVLMPLLYSPSEAVSQRFQILSASTIARMYHSTANLLPDGRVLVGGSNTNTDYAFNGVLFPTELRLEAYSPYYLDSSFSALKPTIIRFYPTTITLNSAFNVQFSVPTSPRSDLQISIYAPPFTTHSVSMNQRLLALSIINVKNLGGSTDLATVKSPPNAVAAPAGYYLLFVVNAGIPSTGAWIQLQA